MELLLSCAPASVIGIVTKCECCLSEAGNVGKVTGSISPQYLVLWVNCYYYLPKHQILYWLQ